MISNENKIDLTDSIVFALNRGAGWRRKMSVLHPLDPRNARASDCLFKLAIEAAGLTDDDFRTLEPYYGFDSKPWREAVSKAARHVCFSHRVKDFKTFVEHLIEVFNEPVVS